MNNNYYGTLDKNFTQALNLYETNHSHKELLELLKNGNIVEKHIAALKLDTITDYDDAEILLSNLTGQDGKIREVISMRLNEFMANPELIKFFNADKNYNIFSEGIIDINANICRNVISAISNLKNNDKFCSVFCTKLIDMTNKLLNKIEQFDFQEGKYKINKEVFKLYWCLETIYEFKEKIDFYALKQIILRSKSIPEYTIREKVAKILTKNYIDKDLIKVKEELKNDSNYYVRRF